MTEPETCEWRNDPEIGLWHLPVCWGAVVGGPECCYCEGPTQLEERLGAIESTLSKLTAALLPSDGSA